MSQSNEDKQAWTLHNFPDSRRLWYVDDANTESLGCHHCYLRPMCGGLKVDANVFDCDSFCTCIDPTRCDNVCSKNLDHYVARMHEVSGFDLTTIQSASPLPPISLPIEIPVIYHGAKRLTPLKLSWVALPLYELFDRRSGCLKAHSAGHLRKWFGLESTTNIILSGTETDPALERWWKIDDRTQVIQELRHLGISLITTPNFSLFDDVPRADNLYNMKRIALSCIESIRHGMPTALHVNARTERDYERWAEFIVMHDEIEWLCAEFGTGAGRPSRISWHAKQLVKVAQSVRRPLRLIARGGLQVLETLGPAYEQIAFVDTTSFVKAQQRQVASVSGGKLSWKAQWTTPGQGIEELIYENISAMGVHTNGLIQGSRAGR
jgi:hypothetical protein